MNVEKHYIIKVDVQQFIKSSLVSNTSDVTQSENLLKIHMCRLEILYF